MADNALAVLVKMQIGAGASAASNFNIYHMQTMELDQLFEEVRRLTEQVLQCRFV